MKLLTPEEGIIKTFMPHDCAGLVSQFDGHLATMFTRGNIKCAASDLFSRQELQDHAPPPGYFMIHQIVMGSDEVYGENNNGDAWPTACLQTYHPTFVTHGRAYREHRNQRPDLAIGDIKAAKFSSKMGRVETLKWLEIKKAEKEYEMAKAGKELHSSMAGHVPYDVCSICSNQAKFSSLYCSDLRDRMKQWDPQAKKYARAINPIATFFDDSVVENPAARMAKHIAYRFPNQDLLKAASSGTPRFSGAQWAQFSQADQPGSMMLHHADAALLRKLASLEGAPRDAYRKAVTAWAFDDTSAPKRQLSKAAKLMPGTFFHKLASRGTLLPFDQFCAYVTGTTPAQVREDEEYVKAASTLPSIFRALADALETGQPCCCRGSDMNLFRASEPAMAKFDPEDGDDEVDDLMSEAADHWSTDSEPLQQRTVRIIVVRKLPEDSAPKEKKASEDLSPLVALYGLYKVAAVRDILARSSNREERHVLACAVDQNLVEKI